MLRHPSQRKNRSPLHIGPVAVTPWKFCICLLVVCLILGTVGLLGVVIPGETGNATTRQLTGGVEFSVKSFKLAWLEIAGVLSIFGYPTLVFWLFWGRLSDEHDAIHGKPDTAPFWRTRIGRVIFYGTVGVLAAIVVWVVLCEVILTPLTHIHRITVIGDDVRFESLYRRWDLSGRDVQQVNVTREVVGDRRGPIARYRAVIQTRSGDLFRTADGLKARPPGGRDDQQYNTFFAEIRTELTKKP